MSGPSGSLWSGYTRGVATVEITLIGKPGCHLCDDARETIERVRAEMAADRGIESTLTELNILEDDQLARQHAEDIPVVRIGGKRHAIWRVEPTKFAAALEKAGRRRLFARR